MPMMARSNVVLPAPLRPRTVMISRSPTVRLKPRSTVVTPYPAQRSAISSNRFPMSSEINVEDSLVAAQLLKAAAGEHAALVKHRHWHVDLPHELHIVFHRNHTDALAQLGDQGGSSSRLLSRHARGGLVEQDHRGLSG